MKNSRKLLSGIFASMTLAAVCGVTAPSALALEDSDTRMTRLGRSELTFGEFSDLDETLRRIAAITADDVRALAADLVDRPLSVAAVGPLDDTAFDGLLSTGSTTGTEVA